jgi:hypothetical protein
MTSYIAIDPGVNGGIAWDTAKLASCMGMPASDTEIAEEIATLAETHHCILGCPRPGVKCVIEDVPKFVGKALPGSTIFPLAFNCGLVRGIAVSLRMPVILVRPQDWQKHFRLGTKGDTSGTTEWKNKLKAEAQRRYPHLKVTLKTADALLLLAYAQEKQL